MTNDIVSKYTEYERIFFKIDRLIEKKDSVVVAIEGGSASGKTTLANILQMVYECNVFHADDFFLRPQQRTKERLGEIGGNLDRERFLEEVIEPLRNRETVVYRRFDCLSKTLGEPITVIPKKLTVVEGAYSMHQAFEKYYDLAIFLDIDPEYQKKRILKRNNLEIATRFFKEWIPLENVYFSGTHIKERVDLILNINEKKR